MAARTDTEFCLVEGVHRLIGRDAANRVQDRLGGIVVYIPNDVRRGHWLTHLLGPDGARKVARDMGGVTVFVPGRSRGHRNRDAIQLMTLAGVPVNVIALTCDMTARHTAEIRACLRSEGDLPQLTAKKRKSCDTSHLSSDDGCRHD